MDARRPSLPVELTSKCCRLLFPDSFFEPGSFTKKPDWKDVKGLTLASKQTREIILSFWFHVLRISNLKDWDVIAHWTRLYGWTRVIHYLSSDYGPKAFLEPFRKLNSIRIDLPYVPLYNDTESPAPEIYKILQMGVPGNVIQHLEIRRIIWLTPKFMRDLAACLPNLRTLKLEHLQGFCWLCNKLGAPAFPSIPEKIIYDGGAGLPDRYSQYLAPLRYLHTVSLRVACQARLIPYELLFSNAPASETDNSPQAESSVSGSRQSNGDPNTVIFPVAQSDLRAPDWLGECENCLVRLLKDNTFRKSWVAQREASYEMTTNPEKVQEHSSRSPSLRRVEWEFFDLTKNFGHWYEGEEEDEDEDEDEV